MTLTKTWILSIPVLALSFTQARDASACGGCFVQQTESTQVTGHRMILSVSKEQTTLWDQIEYSGAPESFAWVLPTKGVVQVDLSSDALFASLEQLTQVQVLSPQINCPPPPCFASAADGNGAGTGAGGGGGVNVIAEEVVGPYETVQLSASDPGALQKWLAGHGYNIPQEVAPIVDAYQAEGFNFLALKLVPGQGVDSMRPVRITTPGASPILPLRMVAAGTGATTAISLWLFSEGRYEPANFPFFTVDASKLVWNWDTSSSNYKDLRQAKFEETKGKAWHVESAEPFSVWQLDSLRYLAQSEPSASGYADANGEGAVEACEADLATLFAGIKQEAVWLSKLHADLPRSALSQDLEVGASMDQSIVPHLLEVTKAVGTPPACPTFPPCGPGNDKDPWSGFWSDDSADDPGQSSCAMGGRAGVPAVASVLGLAAALTLARRRRRSV